MKKKRVQFHCKQNNVIVYTQQKTQYETHNTNLNSLYSIAFHIVMHTVEKTKNQITVSIFKQNSFEAKIQKKIENSIGDRNTNLNYFVSDGMFCIPLTSIRQCIQWKKVMWFTESITIQRSIRSKSFSQKRKFRSQTEI